MALSSGTAPNGARGQTVAQRLQKELMDLMTKPTPGITAFPDDENMTIWTATIEGPPDTPYADLTFKLWMKFADTYPYTPPRVLFKTPIYHPNVDFSGRICLDILKDKWSAIYNITSVLLSLQSLLGEPNTSSPLNGQAAELWDKDQEEFKRHVLARHKQPEELDAC
ncbi:ubiquitin-conjugating enzyme [Lindgomyces ingoldianus]|uniref:Ubiquitin-conjugating enzyme n=1 Tax=Lindgomyces ingoldianus TaxID=673940 RepID=A0ACB6QXV4_9PLEO|nr:ubiquitin-conjugating enzyme [Lindgomyces ingoldianus]KAF2471036.1 ubiquitin-conjugating enzyme [Lindgomyces ingoldianus]